MKCYSCGEEIKEGGAGCDWNQGRCPHRTPMIDEIMLDKYKARFYNLIQWIKGLFK
jgi:hypothetical protein